MNYVWLINQNIEPQLYTMAVAVGTGGIPVYMPAGGLSSAPYGTLMGRPVIPSEFCATLGTAGDIILADLSQYIVIDKGGMQSASSIHVNFTTDETAFRFVYRIDGQPLWKTYLTPYKGSTSYQSPFVVLPSTRT
jgi:HK97 family phage major capsid protein